MTKLRTILLLVAFSLSQVSVEAEEVVPTEKIPEDELVTVESPTEHMSEFIFKPGTLLNLGLPYINKDYYLIEFGFVTAKKYKNLTLITMLT